MSAMTSGAREGLVMAAGVLAVTAYFSWRQVAERGSRGENLSVEDAEYYARRDWRRLLGTSGLGLMGLGILVGSLIPPRAHPIAFVCVWLGVGLLVVTSLILALFDIRANRRYADRHHRLLMEERRSLLQQELRHHLAGQNGSGEPIAGS